MDFPALLVAHLGHVGPAGIVVAAVHTWTLAKEVQQRPTLSLPPNTSGDIHSIRQNLTFTGLETLVPRVFKVRVALLSAELGPRASASATREFAGVVGDTLGTRGRCRSSCTNGSRGYCAICRGVGKKI